MKAIHLALTATLALAACGEDDHNDQHGEASEQIADLEAQVAQLAGELATAKAHTDMAAVQNLQTMLDQANAALAEAKKELDSQDYEEALEELESARAALEAATAARLQAPGTLKLDVKFMFGDAPLTLDHAYTVSGAQFKIDSLRYWLSSVVLVRKDGAEVSIPDTYYAMESRGERLADNLLITDEKGLEVVREGENFGDLRTLPARLRESVSVPNVPPGVYTALKFNVGVDAAHNNDLTMPGGELSAVGGLGADNGWMWFTSYIFTSLEGSFRAADFAEADEDLLFKWENGSNDDLHTVTIPFGADVALDMVIAPHVTLELQADKVIGALDPEAYIRDNPHSDIDPSLIDAKTAEARAALKANWATAFELLSVTQE